MSDEDPNWAPWWWSDIVDSFGDGPSGEDFKAFILDIDSRIHAEGRDEALRLAAERFRWDMLAVLDEHPEKARLRAKGRKEAEQDIVEKLTACAKDLEENGREVTALAAGADNEGRAREWAGMIVAEAVQLVLMERKHGEDMAYLDALQAKIDDAIKRGYPEGNDTSSGTA